MTVTIPNEWAADAAEPMGWVEFETLPGWELEPVSPFRWRLAGNFLDLAGSLVCTDEALRGAPAARLPDHPAFDVVTAGEHVWEGHAAGRRMVQRVRVNDDRTLTILEATYG